MGRRWQVNIYTTELWFCLVSSSSCLMKATAEQEGGVVHIHYLLERIKKVSEILWIPADGSPA